jgi:tetratricopeptide (TPR) repeat protein
VLDAHPEAWLPRYYLGFCYMEMKEPEKAIERFSEVRERKPEWEDPLYRISFIRQVDLDDEEGALEGYLEVLEADPGHQETLRAVDYLAGLRFNAGRMTEAERLFRALDRADPSEPRHLLNLALVERERGKAEEALAIYREGEERFPFEPRFPNDRGLLLMSLGRTDDAFAAFRQALERDPEDLNALENLGAYSRLRGDYDESIRYFRVASQAVEPGSDAAAKFRRYLDMVARERDEQR